MHKIWVAVASLMFLTGMSINDEPVSTEEVDYIWYQMPFQVTHVDKSIYVNEVVFQIHMIREGQKMDVEVKLFTPYGPEKFHAAVDVAATAVLVQGNQWK